MKLLAYAPSGDRANLGPATRSFTLTEVMVVSAIFSMMLAGLLASQMFGLRLLYVTQTKLSATASARQALDQVRDAVRSGKLLYVGTGDASSFTHVSNNMQHIGNALMVCATTNTNNFVVFYRDANDNCLKWRTNGSSQLQVLARYITNALVFQAENFQGVVLTNDQNNRVIHLTMQFYQWEFPVTTVGAGAMYDYYQLQSRITRRLIE
jgi:prepilin-type N-terminal cleavage/methylation domain-containing protein